MSRNIGCDFFAGWVAGIAGIFVGHPMDTIKTYQQVYSVKTREAAKLIREQAGFKGFFRGLTLPLLATGVLNSLFFGGYASTLGYIDSYKKMYMSAEELNYLHNTEVYKAHRGTYLDIFIAGCVAGAIQIPISCPSDLIKVQCQAGIASNATSTSFGIMREIFKQQGLGGFYRGVLAMFWRDVPSSGLWVLTYEWLKDNLAKWSGEKTNVFHQFIAGGLAGSMSWIFVVPFDIVKSQIQATSLSVKNKKDRPCIRKLMKSIFNTNGLIGLTRGTIPICIRAFPVNGVTFVTYEYIYKHCAASFQRKKDDTDKDSAPQSTTQSCSQYRNCVCRKL